MQDFKYFVLQRPEPAPCQMAGCESQEADILCDLCNIQACKRHSFEWSYPNARGYNHPPQKIICAECANSLKDTDTRLVESGDADEDPGRLRRRDGIAWEALRF